MVGLYPHDSKLLRKYGDGGQQTGASAEKEESNPFAFSSLSKLMTSQEDWRRDPRPESINLSVFSNSKVSSRKEVPTIVIEHNLSVRMPLLGLFC